MTTFPACDFPIFFFISYHQAAFPLARLTLALPFDAFVFLFFLLFFEWSPGEGFNRDRRSAPAEWDLTLAFCLFALLTNLGVKFPPISNKGSYSPSLLLPPIIFLARLSDPLQQRQTWGSTLSLRMHCTGRFLSRHAISLSTVSLRLLVGLCWSWASLGPCGDCLALLIRRSCRGDGVR